MKVRLPCLKAGAGLLLAAGCFAAGRMTGPADSPPAQASAPSGKEPGRTRPVPVPPVAAAVAPAEPAPVQDEVKAPAFPESPAEWVAKLTTTLHGSELEAALQSAAEFYAQKGLASAEEFLISLPPGEVSRQALLKVVYELRLKSCPELMAILQENVSKLDRSHVQHGMRELLERWMSSDFEAAARTVCGLDGWKAQEKADMLEAGFWMLCVERKMEANPDALLAQLPDAGVRTELAFVPQVMKMRMRAGFARVIEDFAAAPASVQRNAAGKIPWELPMLPNPEEAMTVLAGSNLPAIVKMRDRSFQNWAESDLYHASEWLADLPSQEMREQLILNSWEAMARADEGVAIKWVDTISDENKRTEIMSKLDTGHPPFPD